jgi:hypothetical protein
MDVHPGIRIHSIPAAGAGGLIFAIGMSAVVFLAVPALRPLLIASVVGGVLLAPLLHLLRR